MVFTQPPASPMQVDVILVEDSPTLQERYAPAAGIGSLHLVVVTHLDDLPQALSDCSDPAAIVAVDSQELRSIMQRARRKCPVVGIVTFSRFLARLDPDSLPPPDELRLMVHVLAPLEG